MKGMKPMEERGEPKVTDDNKIKRRKKDVK